MLWHPCLLNKIFDALGYLVLWLLVLPDERDVGKSVMRTIEMLYIIEIGSEVLYNYTLAGSNCIELVPSSRLVQFSWERSFIRFSVSSVVLKDFGSNLNNIQQTFCSSLSSAAFGLIACHSDCKIQVV